MNLEAYPVDKQVCQLKIQPCKHSVSQDICTPFLNDIDGNSEDIVEVLWKSEKAVSFNVEIMEADLKLLRNETTYCDGAYKGSTVTARV